MSEIEDVLEAVISECGECDTPHEAFLAGLKAAREQGFDTIIELIRAVERELS